MCFELFLGGVASLRVLRKGVPNPRPTEHRMWFPGNKVQVWPDFFKRLYWVIKSLKNRQLRPEKLKKWHLFPSLLRAVERLKVIEWEDEVGPNSQVEKATWSVPLWPPKGPLDAASRCYVPFRLCSQGITPDDDHRMNRMISWGSV